ncbi:LPD3 domain-containing protein [Nitrosovibrio sp. Nv4]|uniref:LPD3 domain-containing protein n=1 Tax=Nitrosovibrio sp. Nv4 TaxID=1945880 RepID=UPI000BE32426|nr:hypothetical protein [Nitrosovibrio sp. Nv4]
MDHSVSRAAHYEAIANIDKLFRLATKGDSRPGTKETDAMTIAAIHHFDVPMPFKGEILHVEMLVKEFTQHPERGGNRIYTLQAVEIATPASKRIAERLGSPNLTSIPPAGATPRFAQMVQIVKGEVRPDGCGHAFSRATTATAANPANGATPFHDRMDRIADTLIYNFQDRFKPPRDIQKRAALVPEAGMRYWPRNGTRVWCGRAPTTSSRTCAIRSSRRPMMISWNMRRSRTTCMRAMPIAHAMRKINPTETGT